jgi:esterase/lipase
MRYGFQAYVFLRVLCCSSLLYSDQLTSALDQISMPQRLQFAQSVQALENALSASVPIQFPVQQHAHSDQTFMRKGLMTLRRNAVGTVLVCHGYTHSKYEGLFFQILFSHFNVVAFDFRGHGELVEKGQFSTIGRDEVFDVLGAVKFIKSNPDLNQKPLIGFGFSMGAVSLLQAQAVSPIFDLLIMDSPFDSSNDCMEQSIKKFLTVRFFGKQFQLPGTSVMMKMVYSESMRPVVKRFFKWASGMDPNKVPTKFVPVMPIMHADKITIPCFFIICAQDKSVGIDRVRRLYDSVQSPFKRFWITKGLKHCGSCLLQPELYRFQVNAFIKKVFDHDFSVPEEIIDDRG